MCRDNAIKTGLQACACLIGGTVVYGQTNHVSIFADDQEYYRALGDLPEPDEINASFTLLDAHVDKTLGTQYGEIADITAIYCERVTAIDTMEKSISKLLTDMQFQILAGWDPRFGTLRAALTGRNLINSIPPEFQRVNLKVQIAQAAFGQGAFSLDYEVLSSPQMSSNSWSDVSTTSKAHDYIDELKERIRARIEEALKNSCEKAIVRDSLSEEQALQTMATRFNMKPAEVDAIRALLRTKNEQ